MYIFDIGWFFVSFDILKGFFLHFSLNYDKSSCKFILKIVHYISLTNIQVNTENLSFF